jgi:phage terminase small subunit
MTPKQELFCLSYIANGLNATKAAKAAGYSYPDRAGSNLLKKPQIRKYIEDAMQHVAMEADEVIQELTNIARHKPDRVYKVGDKLSALDKLAKIRQLYVEKVEHSGELATRIVVEYVDTQGRSAKAPPGASSGGRESEKV